MKTNVLSYPALGRKALWTAALVTAAVSLPWICHLVGDWLGLGSGLGELLLPMHLPVMLAGFVCGPWAGLCCGLMSPVLSALLTGMPAAAMLPFMTVELAVYGLTAGFLRRTPCPSFAKVLATQVAGRLVRAVVLAVAVYAFGFTRLPLSLIWTSLATGAVGVVIQWILLTPLCHRCRP